MLQKEMLAIPISAVLFITPRPALNLCCRDPPSLAILPSSWFALNMKVTLRGWDLLWELGLAYGSCQQALSSFQGCVRTREISFLFILENFSSHSSTWDGSNLSHLFLCLSSEVVILTAFDPIDIRRRKLVIKWCFQFGYYKVVLNF